MADVCDEILNPVVDGEIDSLMVSLRDGLDDHPFRHVSSCAALEKIFPHYLAMSQAFPYLQAGAQVHAVLDAIQSNRPVARDVEITSVVGNFLCWDETGGAYVIERYGKQGLQGILDTGKWFHSSLLKNDIERLTGRVAVPNFSVPTGPYLTKLLAGLGAKTALERCANMVAFELHANAMIDALWASTSRCYGVDRQGLVYFQCHVGGDDPAEAYHVEMTRRMIQLLVSDDEIPEFAVRVAQAVSDNVSWCAALVSLAE
ncbi:hypothetical protein WS98_12145 [Burkholderia territorii]|uniref:Uncharacterized protein n=3 Tax=Burkholderia cepacia complex TaxID=87882 RepID=A0A6P3BWV5_9BURK|nr:MULTISPECIES: hypothetical protein [Burkholderia]KVL37938.1 hypothetical protein WS98_12145 [Burkholderia territorii]KVL45488.1 hypothetical protein WT00_28775 [Burkholderia territorii]KVL55179.1 hypothetical protein WS99_10025 [Burkholderia territorii]KVN42517.1 hypothetical protein WT12_27815 [Burkholderia territorii]KVQ53895.1 hypothetical protein WT22_28675 [Burkholderia territorii]